MELWKSIRVLLRALALAFSMCAFGIAVPALANNVSAPGCVASVPSNLALKPGTRVALDWRCDGEIPDLGPGRIAVMLGIAPNGQGYLESHNGYFDQLTLIAMDGDQILITASHDGETIPAGYTDIRFAVPLPILESGLSSFEERGPTYMVVFEGTEFPSVISDAILTDTPINARSETVFKVIFVAMFIGFLLLPAIVDLAFFRVLKAKFLIWHACLAIAMAWHLTTSGLLSVFFPISVITITSQAMLSFGAVSVSGIFFATLFIERSKQSPRLRRALYWGAAAIVVVTGLRLARIDILEPYSAKAYFALYVPLLGLMIAFVTSAALKGSRAVWFQIVAWTPFLFLGIVRLATMLGTDASYVEGVWLFRFGAITEVTITTLGIVDRFIAIKRERDLAKTNAETLTRLSERDALTGLFNRRAIEDRFTDLRSQGFDTFALIDLDRFKSINDDFGHQIGDRALVACASAINGPKTVSTDRDTIALRLGGEEFFVLLRGEQTLERAEALRQSIPLRVANEVEGLDRPVTASMGVIELPCDCNELMDFEELYARTDQLLYEAKAAGRNRMCYERLKIFREAPASRPNEGAAA